MIPKKETLTVEFISDLKGLPDCVLVEEVVAMSNSEGGDIYIGVEDDGTPSGAKREHLDPSWAKMLLLSQTFPPVAAEADIIDESGVFVLRVHVPISPSITSTSSGKTLQRKLRFDGSPEMRPLYPYEFESRRSYLRQADPSADYSFPYDASLIDEESIENALGIIKNKQNADKTLLGLEKEGFLSSTGAVIMDPNSKPRLTMAGLLLFGKKDSIAKNCPSASFSFVRLKGDKVLENEEVCLNVIEAFEVFSAFLDKIQENDEFIFNMVRYDVPIYDVDAMREAFANAIAHRDYAIYSPIRVSYDGTCLTIFNPGRLIRGLNPSNLIGASPRGRNPLLSGCLKRLGLCENTGRGVDRIYASFARYGKTWPSYLGSDEFGVTLTMPRSRIDGPFAGYCLTHKNVLTPLPLLCLSLIRQRRGATETEIAKELAFPVELIKTYLYDMEGLGLVLKDGVNYILPRLKNETAEPSKITPNELSNKVLELAKNSKDGIVSSDVQDYFGVDGNKAYYLLKKLVEEGKLTKVGEGRYSKYFSKAK